MLRQALGLALVLLVSPAWPSAAQSTPVGSQPAPSGQPAARFTLPPITVTAQKEPADPATLPTSITTVSWDLFDPWPTERVSDAAGLSPNTHFTEFSARKLSNPRMRGIGASPANPGVMTYIDGVPQFNANTSSVDLLDVGQIEFVRGPQGALFGRNALGGLINITTRAPSMSGWTSHVTAPFGSAGSFDVSAGASGPLKAGTSALGLAVHYGRRDGFTTNDLTGHDVDRRSAWSGKAQLLWAPAPAWDVRVIVSGERARDGDYALNDLAEVRRNPFHVSRDFAGWTNRDIIATTLLARRSGPRFSLTTTTGVVGWRTVDATDLDYSALPIARRDNEEHAVQFTQEVRLASVPSSRAPASSGGLSFKWQAGALVFTQHYEQNAANTFAPYTLSPSVGVPIVYQSPDGTLSDFGVGLYGQGTLSFGRRVDLSLGARFDHERKDALLATSYTPAIAPPTSLDAARQFSDVSPQVSTAVHLRPGTMAYVSAGRGFKAGGFNPTSPAGNEAYGEEHAWHVEGGVKALAAGNRVSLSAAVFSIAWDDLQNNLPDPTSPGRFYIANVGGARSRGVEAEVTARLLAGVDVFGAWGVTHARFAADTSSNGIDVGDNLVPNTPDYTAAAGVQATQPVRSLGRLHGRIEVVRTGAFEYDDANTVGQDAYTLVNIRAGLRGKVLSVDGWVRNVLDTRYVPVAFAYPGFAPSGFVGEPGAPRLFGLSVGVAF